MGSDQTESPRPRTLPRDYRPAPLARLTSIKKLTKAKAILLRIHYRPPMLYIHY